MIGEVWEDASNKIAYGTPREYLSGNEMDSAMNYPLRTIELLDVPHGCVWTGIRPRASCKPDRELPEGKISMR